MDRIRFGIIGLRLGKEYLQHLVRHPQAEVTAICDIDEPLLEEVVAHSDVDIPVCSMDYRDVICCKQVDAVIVATPDNLHKLHAVDAIEAGKHVLCEKPLALTRQDCQVMIDAEAKSDKRFCVGQICRYAPGFRKARQLYRAGVIGELFLSSRSMPTTTPIWMRKTRITGGATLS